MEIYDQIKKSGKSWVETLNVRKTFVSIRHQTSQTFILNNCSKHIIDYVYAIGSLLDIFSSHTDNCDCHK